MPKYQPGQEIENTQTFRQAILHTLSKLNDPHTQAKAEEEFIEICKLYGQSIERIHLVINLLGDQSQLDHNSRLSTKKQYIKLYGLAAEVYGFKILEFFPKILQNLNKKLKEQDNSLHQAIGDCFGLLLEFSLKELTPQEALPFVTQVLMFIFTNLSDKSKQLQAGSAIALSKVIQSCPLEVLYELSNEIVKKINDCYQNTQFKAQNHLLEALLSLLVGIEDKFNPYCQIIMPLIIGSMTDSQWAVRKISVDIIYTIAILMPQELIPFQRQCIEILNQSRFDKIKHVRDASIIALNVLKEQNQQFQNEQEESYPQSRVSQQISENFYNENQIQKQQNFNQNQYMNDPQEEFIDKIEQPKQDYDQIQSSYKQNQNQNQINNQKSPKPIRKRNISPFRNQYKKPELKENKSIFQGKKNNINIKKIKNQYSKIKFYNQGPRNTDFFKNFSKHDDGIQIVVDQNLEKKQQEVKERQEKQEQNKPNKNQQNSSDDKLNDAYSMALTSNNDKLLLQLMEQTGGDNLKGLLFCERPNQKQQVNPDTKKPFLSRVQYTDKIGLNPVKKEIEALPQPQKKTNEILKRHKEWLEVYKLKMKYKKEMKDDALIESKEKFEKIKEQAAQNRIKTKKMKEEFDALNKQIMNELDGDSPQKKPKTYKLTKENLKKLQELNSVIPDKNKKPKQNYENYEQEYEQQQKEEEQQQQFQNQSQNQNQEQNNFNDSFEKESNISYSKKPTLTKKSNKKNKRPKKEYLTEEQYKAKQEAEEDEELDDLLGFVDNLNYDKYINDLEVQTMIKSIKDRVTELKKDENWKQKAYQRIQQKREEIRQEKLKQQQAAAERDSASIFSEGSKSVASERTMQSIQSLKEQIQNRDQGKNIDWERNTKGETITFEQKIAKLVADEVLRNYKNLGNIHSNKSIRQMLESEATKQLQPSTQDIQQRYDGPNINIVKERQLRKDQVDPNTLPYMHRNPAI
ncbi:Armadillo-type fold [Pseudocohnilembus persalinus]|uniref:Armadillo-type fold n=1 Tax=Pseudocohnilembus persalinus TaxID=266149 RepID=A0A0V0R8R4_PSEPJ|nr:Armadillo-type fold [Pseudocohnilembus persalinus]|eukprot:KRX10893.1 Armadillo-type fold [Pseudocohnilembus persalinus]